VAGGDGSPREGRRTVNLQRQQYASEISSQVRVYPGVREPPLTADLPQRLQRETHDLHHQAERTGLMASLLSGRIAQPVYCALLRNLHALYEALELALRQPLASRLLAPLDMPALSRSASLAADLDVIHGPGWAEAWPLQAATSGYIARLEHLGRIDSPALVAHAYVRYLGDLHGGQLLRARVAKGLGLTGEAGTRFYDFGPADRVLALRGAFRQMLAGLPLSADDCSLVVAEARWGFEQHRRLFEQLQPAGG